MTMQDFSISPMEITKSLWRNRTLLNALIRRDFIGRYRGSVLGILWSFFNPVLMLVVYTFVFGVILKARWNIGSDAKTEFALVLFSGLTVFNLFSEVVTRAPSLILANTNYVKKVVFPLEILPWVSLGSSLLHALISFGVWLIFYGLFLGIPPVTIFWLPVVLMPIITLTMGLGWFFASLGVYLRDISQVISLLTNMLMFLSPIFYPLSSLPEDYRALFRLNPITPSVELVRDVLIWGKHPDWPTFQFSLVLSLAIFFLGFAWFQKTRKGFADVL